MKPTVDDLKEWEELCTFISGLKKKSTYISKYYKSNVPNTHLLSQEKIYREMRKWMKDNGYELVFWGCGWGWRLRKDWKEKLERLKANIEVGDI
ncbi:hypothetical protein HNQ34_001994 [Anoxybacillus tepidamans]|uniref:Uncharacterized protein n=1 Tax=Anoxybacteroides tepidamans TaxID=265948 RepID=A0A7W8MW24_9BACL|nr:hypothetical protein [Anoxybacillus tepidamans]MBB5324896.1 hypothetical protein [Anoxybacillus tepidamans]